jgi:uncharacterized protein (TIGR00304 family)
MSEQLLWSIGSTLVFMGFAIVIIAIILLFLKNAKSEKGKVKGGGVVIIGPIPIIFGTDKESVKIILVLSVILMILVLVWIVIYYSFQ